MQHHAKRQTHQQIDHAPRYRKDDGGRCEGRFCDVGVPLDECRTLHIGAQPPHQKAERNRDKIEKKCSHILSFFACCRSEFFCLRLPMLRAFCFFACCRGEFFFASPDIFFSALLLDTFSALSPDTFALPHRK